MIDELALLKCAGEGLDVEGAAAEEHARVALQRAIASERRLLRGRRGPAARRRLSVRMAIVLAVAALALVIAAATRSGSSTGPPAAAGAVLERLARVAGAQPARVPERGQYLYSESRSLSNATVASRGLYCQFDFTEARQNWIAANGQGLFIERDGPQHLEAGSPADCRSLLPQSALSAGVSRTWAAPGCLSTSPVPLGGLPRNPAALRARLLTGKVEGGPPGAAEAFTQVGDLLRETDAPPALRAALYRAAAGLAGVRNLGTVADPLGRQGVGLAIDDHGIRHELIFDPRTSALLAQRGVVIAHTRGEDAALGSLAYWSAYTPGRVVSRLPAPSPLPLRPACVRGGGTVRQVPGRAADSVIVGSSSLRAAAGSRSSRRAV